MTKLYNPPRPLVVELDPQGQPQSLQWRGSLYHGACRDHWRIQTEWWETEIARDYYLWEGDQLSCVIYCDAQQHWYLQRIFD